MHMDDISLLMMDCAAARLYHWKFTLEFNALAYISVRNNDAPESNIIEAAV